MSEEEIIQSINNVLKYKSEINLAPFKITVVEGLLDLYNKEKEKNKELTIKNHFLKNESNAYGEAIVKLDNQLKVTNQEIEYLNCIIESDKDNYIHKDKIRETSKFFEKEIKEDGVLTKLNNYDLLRAVINRLQDLLEEDNK